MGLISGLLGLKEHGAVRGFHKDLLNSKLNKLGVERGMAIMTCLDAPNLRGEPKRQHSLMDEQVFLSKLHSLSDPTSRMSVNPRPQLIASFVLVGLRPKVAGATSAALRIRVASSVV
jgi:hypothetical protein